VASSIVAWVLSIWTDTGFNNDLHTFHVIFAPLILVLVLPWLKDEQASLMFGTVRGIALMDGTIIETQTKERRFECFVMSSNEAKNLMQKTRRSKRHNDDFFVINFTQATT
jgi:hypothetical protein